MAQLNAELRQKLLSKLICGEYELEIYDHKYISNNIKTEQFYEKTIVECNGDILEANDRIYEILFKIISTSYGYQDSTRKGSVTAGDVVWIFPRGSHYVKLGFPWGSSDLSIVIHEHS